MARFTRSAAVQPVHAAGQRGEADARALRSAKVFSAAMMRSQASAISKPPPSTPLTAVMIGLSCSQKARCRRSRPCSSRASRSRPAISDRCRQKFVVGAGDDRYPLGSAEKSSNTFVEPECASMCSALYTSGARQRDDRTGSFARYPDEFQIHVCSRCDFFCGEEYWRRYQRVAAVRYHAIMQGIRACQALLPCLTWAASSPYPIRTGARSQRLNANHNKRHFPGELDFNLPADPSPISTKTSIASLNARSSC